MAGNSQRKGAVRKRGKGIGSTGRTAGSGGRVRQGLEGRGPTPKAEDRPYHKAYRKRRPDDPQKTVGGKPKGAKSGRSAGPSGTATAGDERKPALPRVLSHFVTQSGIADKPR